MAIEISKLDNGLTVASDAMDHVQSATVGVWVNAGGRYETPEVLGVSHFLEHMAFKGTTSRSSVEIVEEIEAVGGYLNAYTSREQTGYYTRCLRDDVALSIDLLSDILLRSTFDPQELERERGVIIQEIGQSTDNPEDLIHDLLQDAAFPDQPLGRPILGTVDTVNAMSRDALKGHMAEHYAPANMMVIASGAVEHESFVTLVQEAFGDLKAQPTSYEPAKGLYKGGVDLTDRDLEQVHVALAFPGLAAKEDDIFTAQVYSEILGGGMSSRLFQEVREKRGLCYSVYAYHAAYSDTGLFGVYAGTSAQDVEELLTVISGEMGKLATHVEERELARAMAQAKSSVLMSWKALIPGQNGSPNICHALVVS